MILKAQALRPGQQIGIIAPSGPVDSDKLRLGIEILTSYGFKPVLGSHLFQRKGYLAGDDTSRLEDLHGMIRNENIKAIFCARGGYGSTRLLDGIDYDLIGRNPKIILGCSDITALLLSFWEKTGLVTFHGPLVTSLSNGGVNNVDGLLDLLRGKDNVCIALGPAGIYHPGKTEGILMGGNLSLLIHLIGTPYLPSFDDSILFIEDRGELPYRLDRMLTHLRMSGRLKNIKGLMLGTFIDCGTDEEIQQVMDNCFSDMDIPILYGCPFGHGELNVTLPIGVRGRLDTEGMVLQIVEVPVKRQT